MRIRSIIVLACIWNEVVCGTSLPRPLTEGEVSGTWVGYELGELAFYRLSLNRAHHGSCNVLYNRKSLTKYFVQNWALTNDTVQVDIVPVKEGSEPFSISVEHLSRLKMEVTVFNEDHGWKRKATLYREKEWLARNKQAGK
jgi:hypothetical protein